MQDSFGRNINYMRISLTDRCNYACYYCKPDISKHLCHSDILTYEQLLDICRCAITLGITRFKITGGEPTLRKGYIDFIRRLKELDGVEQVTLTTNGSLFSFTDLDKLNYAAFMTRLVSDVTYENQYTYNILQLLLNTLYLLSETDTDKDFILSVFEIRLMVILGFCPRLDKCALCGNKENIGYFSISNNGYLCNNCGFLDKSAIKIC